MRKLGCLVLLIAGLVIGAIVAANMWAGAGPADKPVSVVVPAGASLARAATALEQAGAIRSAHRFRLLARVFGGGGSVKAGEYEIPAHASAKQILDLLEEGKVRQRLVVVPEGLPSVMVHDALMKADGLTGSVPVPAEGSVLPMAMPISAAIRAPRCWRGCSRRCAIIWPRPGPSAPRPAR